MGWNCINCESANDFSSTHCDVCGYERYFSITEVNDLLEKQQLSPGDIKKVQTSFKRASTDNKKLRQENKDLVKKMSFLQDFYDNHGDRTEALENSINALKKNKLQWKIAFTIAALLILFLFLAKVSVSISFAGF